MNNMRYYLFCFIYFFLQACSTHTEETKAVEPQNRDSSQVETQAEMSQNKAVSQEPVEKKLPIPTTDFLKQTEEHDMSFTYFTTYFKPISKRKVLKRYKDCERDDCTSSWEQYFEDSILYREVEIEEIGSEITIIFPNYNKEEVVKYIDWFCHSEDNKWNKDKTSYAPKDDGAGCYYEIKLNDKKQYYIHNYCGC